MTSTTHTLIIIGAGPAGLTAAIYAARANLHPVVIEGPKPGGQLMDTTIIENWPGNEAIDGPTLMLSMRDHAKKLGATLLSESVVKVDFSKQPFALWTDRNNALTAHAVILATGASPNRLKVLGEQDYWGKGITTCAVCDAAFYKDKKVVIIGGGDTAMEEASFLKKFTKDITIIQLLDKLTASYAMQQRIIHDPDITILYNSTVTQFHGDGQRLNKITLKNQKTGTQEERAVDGAFLAIGLTPNTAIFKGQVGLDSHGYIVVTEHTKTSVAGIFAAGDAQDYRYRQAITSAGAGCMAALDAEHYLANKSA
jgi:thioredoxin reductase (NADPH)